MGSGCLYSLVVGGRFSLRSDWLIVRIEREKLIIHFFKLIFFVKSPRRIKTIQNWITIPKRILIKFGIIYYFWRYKDLFWSKWNYSLFWASFFSISFAKDWGKFVMNCQERGNVKMKIGYIIFERVVSYVKWKYHIHWISVTQIRSLREMRVNAHPCHWTVQSVTSPLCSSKLFLYVWYF